VTSGPPGRYVLCAALLALACAIDDGAQVGVALETTRLPPCSRPKSAPISAVTELRQAADFECQIVVMDSGIELRPSMSDAYPDPRTPVVMDSKGRLYTAARHEPVLLAWNPDGRFMQVIGSKGEGPGEFVRGPLTFITGPGDTLYVRDGALRTSVFDPDFKFVRTNHPTGALGLTTHVTTDGLLIHTLPIQGGRKDAAFHITFPGEAASVRSIGSVRAGRAADGLARRPSTFSAPNELWIAPAKGTGAGFILERRRLDGTLVQLIKRDVPWLPLDGYPDEPMAPDFKFLHVDDQGLLWIAVAVKDPRWSKTRGASSDAEQGDLRLEVIDPESAQVLASVRFDSVSETALPTIYPIRPGSPLVYGTYTDSLGFRIIRIGELALARK
jgi:hypothetical protein